MEKLSFKKGTVIFKEGDTEKTMFDIRLGSVGIYANYGTKEQKLLKKLTSEDFFGELAMIDGSPRSATAVALEDAQAWVISRENFKDYFATKPAKALLILQSISHRIRELTKEYINVCDVLDTYVSAKDAGEKVDKELLFQMQQIAAKGKN